MNKKELRGLIKKVTTIANARKQVQEQVKRWGYDNTKIYVRCYSEVSWGTTFFSTDLYVEMTNGEDWEKITVATIEIDTEEEGKYFGMNIDIEEFEELTWDIFKTLKKNMIKELETYNYTITDTEDYHI